MPPVSSAMAYPGIIPSPLSPRQPAAAAAAAERRPPLPCVAAACPSPRLQHAALPVRHAACLPWRTTKREERESGGGTGKGMYKKSVFLTEEGGYRKYGIQASDAEANGAIA